MTTLMYVAIVLAVLIASFSGACGPIHSGPALDRYQRARGQDLSADQRLQELGIVVAI
jgi:hypothetical protein